MAKRAGKKVAKRRAGGPSGPGAAAGAGDDALDPRRLFAMLAEALSARAPPGSRPGRTPRLPPKQVARLEAEALVEAAERLDPREHPAEREALARRALGASKHHAEAWCVLADQAATADEAVALFETAVSSGERFLGKAALARHRGAVVAVPGGAGLLRARRGLVEALAASGRAAEAIDAGRRVLEIDAIDRTAVRVRLVALLVGERRFGEARDVHASMDASHEPCRAWGAALVEFAEHGATPAAAQRLAAAMTVNRHAAAALLGEDSRGAGRSPSAAFDAEVCAAALLAAWRDVPGATAWLRDAMGSPGRSGSRGGKKRSVGKARGRRGDSATGVEPAPEASGIPLGALPLDADDVWEVDLRLLPMWVGKEGRMRRPWGLLVASRWYDRVIEHDIFPERPAETDLVAAIVSLLRKGGLCPATIEITDPVLGAALGTAVVGAGVAVVPRDGLALVERLVGMMTSALSAGGGAGPLLALPGVTPAMAEEFHSAAAVFHRARPWRRLPVDTPIMVRGGPTWAAELGVIVLGWSGVQQGLAIYDDMASLRATVEHDAAAMERGRALSVLYGEAFEIPEVDLLAVERFGFEVACPEAYPSIIGVVPGLEKREPLDREIVLASRLLRAVPAFVQTVERGDASGWRAPCGLELSWG